MFRIKWQRTLREDIEKLQQENTGREVGKNRQTEKKCASWVKWMSTLLFLFVGYRLDHAYQTLVILLAIELVRCLFAKHKLQKRKKCNKVDQQQELVVRTLSQAMLLSYLGIVGLALTFYGCMNYFLHLPVDALDLKGWLQYSFLVLLIFETITLRFYRKKESEVSEK